MFAPDATSVSETPLQIVVALGITVTTGAELTFTVAVVVSEHAPVVPITVYIVVPEGLAMTVFPVVVFNPVAGDQTYVLAPDATKVSDVPPQIAVVFGITFMVGVGFTVTLTVAVPEHPPDVLVTV